MSNKLSDKQQRFVLEYLQDQNAAAAARRAGYSDKTNGSQAAALMKNPLVRERICAELADIYSALRVNAVSILQAQARAAFFDPRKMFDAAGEPVPISALDDDTAAVLTVNYDQRPSGKCLRVRPAPRQPALAALEKSYAQFLDMDLARIQDAARDDDEAVDCEALDEADEEASASQAAAPSPAPAARETTPVRPVRQAAKPNPGTTRRATGAAPWRKSGLLSGLYGRPAPAPAKEHATPARAAAAA